MKIVYIHGANATSTSFNFIRAQLTGYQEVLIEYHSSYGFMNNLKELRNSFTQDKCYVISHSLGGLYALHLSRYFPNIFGCTSIGTPFNGSEMATYLKYLFPRTQLFWDICPSSLPVLTGKKIKITFPWQQLVTTGKGQPWFPLKNDGVVSIESMRSRTDVKNIIIESGHYEGLLDYKTIDLIKTHIKWCL